PNNDIQVEDPAVSGKHAEVKIEDGRFFVYDCSSTNGILVYTLESDHWEKVERHEIKDGTRIKLGRTLFHLMALTVECC
ncbi:MAG TPA: FHA domain-containing protein, partial [Anaerolineae bacterium]